MDPNQSSLSSLSDDLLREVLCRIPAESLVRSKRTCKKWNAMISDKKFWYENWSHSRELFIRTVDKVQIVDPVTGTRTRTESVMLNALLHPYEISEIVHCDGLLLFKCSLKSSRKVRLAVCNYVLQKIKWIEASKCCTYRDLHGFGYDAREAYKILRFVDGLYYDEVKDGERVEIYDCVKKSWRTLETSVEWDVHCKALSIMGKNYWLARNKDRQDLILSFDFKRESFTEICLCPDQSTPSSGEYFLSVFKGDGLVLLKQDDVTKDIDVWVSTNLDKASFSRYMSVSGLPALQPMTYFFCLPVFCLVKQKLIAAWCEGSAEGDDDGVRWYLPFTVYHFGEHGLINQMEVERDYIHSSPVGDGYRPCGYLFNPSLIPLP